MNKTSLEFLKRLLAEPTPSGYEERGQAVIREYMLEHADVVETDVHGNVHGVMNPDGEVRVMLAGHCDEIGLMIMHVDDKGFLYFASVGGVNLQLLQGERVVVHNKNGPVPGVIGVKPIHLMSAKERGEGVKHAHDLWIDIGAKDKKDALKLVEPGDVVTIDTGWVELRNGLIACRGFDDRIGAFIVADVLRALKGKKIKAAVHAVSTVQEEIGLRGAKTAAFGVDPDIGVAVDVGFATDFPGVNAKQVGEAKVGGGPILHRGPNFNHRVYDLLHSTAKSSRIQIQQQPIPRGSGTDANAMQVNRAGVATALVSIPNRYMHSPVEIVALRDVEAAVKLIAAFIRKISGKTELIP